MGSRFDDLLSGRLGYLGRKLVVKENGYCGYRHQGRPTIRPIRFAKVLAERKSGGRVARPRWRYCKPVSTNNTPLPLPPPQAGTVDSRSVIFWSSIRFLEPSQQRAGLLSQSSAERGLQCWVVTA